MSDFRTPDLPTSTQVRTVAHVSINPVITTATATLALDPVPGIIELRASGGALAYTLAAPGGGVKDGSLICIRGNGTDAHTLDVATSGSTLNRVTFAQADETVTFMAMNGDWIPLGHFFTSASPLS